MKKKKPELYALSSWEEKNGELTVQSLKNWIQENNLSAKKVKENIEEFRLRMEAGGNCYANFEAAFKLWFRKGWLLHDLVKAQNINNQTQIRFYNKGVNL